MGVEEFQAAWELLKEAYQYQMGGDYDMAVELYKRSLDLHPTAEAFTFLGWTYRFQGKIEDAIAECKKAIQLDPEFGTPYNDIGAYLIEKGEFDEIGMPRIARGRESSPKNRAQLSLFTDENDIIINELKTLDVLNMTPLEALQKLNAWKDRLR